MFYKHYHRSQEPGILLDYQNTLPLPSKMVRVSLPIQSHYLILPRTSRIEARYYYLQRRPLSKRRKSCIQLCQPAKHVLCLYSQPTHYIPLSHGLSFFKTFGLLSLLTLIACIVTSSQQLGKTRYCRNISANQRNIGYFIYPDFCSKTEKFMYCKKMIFVHVFCNTIMITSSWITSDKIKH